MIPAPYPWRCIRLPPCPEPLRPPSPALWDSLCIIRYRTKKGAVSNCFRPYPLLPTRLNSSLRSSNIAAKDGQ